MESKVVSEQIFNIDFSDTYNPDAGYMARRVIQYLFDYYREHDGELEDIEHLLIDYDTFKKYFEVHKPFEIYWFLIDSDTYIREYPVFLTDETLKIIWDGHKKVYFYKEELCAT